MAEEADVTALSFEEALKELERIVATPGLSKDVFEQASKSLN